jgi:hypothetical protein
MLIFAHINSVYGLQMVRYDVLEQMPPFMGGGEMIEVCSLQAGVSAFFLRSLQYMSLVKEAEAIFESACAWHRMFTLTTPPTRHPHRDLSPAPRP